MTAKLAIVGSAGRMGRRIIALAQEDSNFEIVAAVEQSGHPDIGKKINGIDISPEFPKEADVVIEFALPEASGRTAEFCVAKNAALVMGTTGLDSEQKSKVEAAAKKVPVIYGTNMSVGMNVMFSLAAKAAIILGDQYDIEIIEKHHRFKKDSPSGSALTLAEKICRATGRDAGNCLIYGRHGKSERAKGTIGIHAVRAGDITGEHDVIFSTLGETVTLSHSAHNRDNFARGALLAAQWLVGKKPGLYTMADVLKI